MTSLLSSVMLLVFTESITSSASLEFSFSLTLSILLRFWGFDKLSFLISSTVFPNMFYFSTVSVLLYLINSSGFFLTLTSSSSSCAIYCSVTCCIGSVPVWFCSFCWASLLFSPLSASLLISSNCSCDSQPFF